MSEEIQKRNVMDITLGDIEKMAYAVAKSGLFGMKTPEQAMALMLISQAEGRHPALAARDYDIIQGRPSKKAESMLRDFQASGGKVKWIQRDKKCAKATFSHPQSPEPITVTWDDEAVKTAELDGKSMHKKYPRQMKHARTVSEGVRATWPAATSGMYVPEEVRDFDNEPRNVTPPKTTTTTTVTTNPKEKKQSTKEAEQKKETETKLSPTQILEIHSVMKAKIDSLWKLTSMPVDEIFQKLIKVNGKDVSRAKAEHIDKMANPKNVNCLKRAIENADIWINELEKSKGSLYE